MKKSLLFSIIVLSLISCKKDEDSNTSVTKPPSKNYNIQGVAQKGPFQLGSTVVVYELDNSLKPTGLSYETIVKNHLGEYEFTGIGLSYNYVKISVEGTYFHEIRNGIPFGEDQTLQVVADLSKSTDININVLTDLQQARLVKLVQSGVKFDKARDQSFSELLSVFGISSSIVDYPERLNLITNDNNGALLFALSNLIANKIGAPQYNIPQVIEALKIDFQSDGKIDEAWLQKTLASSALLLDLNVPSQNLIEWYKSLGKTITPAVDNSILQDFILQSGFPTIVDGVFPETIGQKINFFGMEDTIYINAADSNMFAIDLVTSSQVSMVRATITNTSGIYSIPYPSNWNNIGTGYETTVRVNDPLLATFFDFSGSGSFTLDLLLLETSAGPGTFRTKTIIWN